MADFFKKIIKQPTQQRSLRLPTCEVANLGSNMLVISDLHLGEDLSEFGGPELSNLVAGLNSVLSAMLAYFTQNRWNDIPWELVLAGDTFDFLKDSLRKCAPRADPLWLEKNPETARLLNNGETVTAIASKVEQIGAAHAPIFEALADFLAAGNSLVLISGNHDLELYFDEVQAAVKDLLKTTYCRLRHLRGQEDPAPGELDAWDRRITFSKWFYTRPGLCYLEHGHLSDQWCSVANPLLPLSRLVPPLAAIPFIQRAMPYVADLLPDFSSHGIENLSIPELVSSLSWRNRLGLFRAMQSAIHDLAREDPEEEQIIAAHAQGLLPAFAATAPYSQEVLEKLLAAITPPMKLTLPKLVYECAHPRDSMVELRHYAATLAGITTAKVVLIGHSHIPEQLILKSSRGDRFTYINCGSWVSREVKTGSEGLGQTFAIITPYSKKPAQLYQWLGTDELWDGRPYRPYSPFLPE